MAKSKYSPALFEVMNRQRNSGKLSVPKWWKSSGSPSEAGQSDASMPQTPPPQTDSQATGEQAVASPTGADDAAVATSSPVSGSVHRPVGLDGRDGFAPSAGAVDAGSTWLPTVRVAGNRMQVSLSVVQGCVAAGLLLVFLAGSFELGRALAPGPQAGKADALSAALSQKPDDSVLDSPGNVSGKADQATASIAENARSAFAAASGGDQGSAETTGNAGLTPGLNYLVLDGYKLDHKASAEHVRKWLREEHGIDTMLYMSPERYYLISATGFNRDMPDQKQACDDLLEKVKSLGAACRKELIRADLPVYGFAGPLIRRF